MTELLTSALAEVAGPALVLDGRLRVVAFTEAAVRALGARPDVGVSAPKQLCGTGESRPLAEALAAGRPASARIVRTVGRAARPLRVRATPIEGGWLITLSEDAPVDEAWGIVTRDPAMRQLLGDVAKVARSAASVLVRGETGSGKELVARAIHRASPRAGGPFRAINCAALPPNLLESELFGHARGAFTGAVRDAPGHFRLAERGTIFLDEVAELPLEVQAKLLRVLQERTVIPVGGREPVEIDVRVVSATHRALRREVEAGRFRADLLYRLRVIPIFLPPLRDRLDDIEPLAWHVLAQLEAPVRRIERIADGALRAMQAYDWPGNVRELWNAMEYATVMGEGPLLSVTDLPPEVRGVDPILSMNRPREAERDAWSHLPADARRLLRALERSDGHMERAARSLGISRTTLWRRLKKHGIDRSAFEG